QERMKRAERVASATDAGDEQVRQAFFAFEDLPARFDSDNTLKIAHQHGIGMGAENRSQYIMSSSNIGDPVAHRLVDGLFERRLPRGDRDYFGSQEFHAGNV